MKARTIIGVALLCVLSAPLLAQVGPPAQPPPPPAAVEPAEVMRQMGADEDAVMKFQLLSQVLGPDATPLLLLMMMNDGGNMDSDFLPIMLLMKAAAGSGAGGPAAVMNGNRLYIIDDGTVYVLDTVAMKLEGSVPYRPAKPAAGLPPELLPMLQGAKDKAMATSCLSNMKQLCLAAMMYAQDWDEVLPGEQWPEQLQPYIKNMQIYKCPGLPDREYAYALNEALAGAKLGDIKRPAETVFFFESNLPDDMPFGGPDGLLMEPHHAGVVTIGFADGHCQLMKPEEAKKLLEQDPFEDR